MLETNIKSIQHIPMLAKVLGIVLLFVLTSCPIKASIKHSFNQQASVENKANKSLKSDLLTDYSSFECSVALENLNGTQMASPDFHLQPALVSFGFALLLVFFLPKREKTNDEWVAPGPNSQPLFLQYRRLNL